MSKNSKAEIDKFMSRKSEITFKFLDSDKDGILSIGDLMTFPVELRRVGKVKYSETLSTAYQGIWDRMLQVVNKPLGSTDMSKNEFIQGQNAVRTTTWYRQEFLSRIVNVYYDSVDTNNDGVIGLDEWKDFYKSRGIDDEDFIQWTFDKLDTDMDGCISREEFQHAWMMFGIGEDPDQDYSFLYDIKHPAIA